LVLNIYTNQALVCKVWGRSSMTSSRIARREGEVARGERNA
jgi:hypothetical protein